MNSEERSALTTQFWRFLWSAILIALSGCLGNVVDSIIVGNLIGGDGVSAINLSKPVVQFMFTISMLISAGAGMLVGMALGKQDHQRAAYIYTHSFFGSLVFGFLLTVCGILFPDLITGWLRQNEHLFQPTRDYLVVMLWGAPAYMVMWALTTMAGVDGSPRLVSIAILIDNVINLALDILFIRYFDMGIAGSSLATVVGHVVGIAMMCRHFYYKDNHLHPTLQAAGVSVATAMKEILSEGAPLAIASICLTLLLFSSNSIMLSSLGRVGIFAFALCMNLLQVYNLFLAGVCRTIQSLGSIQVGKRDNEAFALVLHKSFVFITCAMFITCIFIWVDPESVARLFGADEEDLVSEGCTALRIYAPSIIPFCYIYTLMVVYKLYSYHKMALFLSFALSLTVIPVLWLVSRYAPHLLWYSFLIAYVIEALLIVAFHRLSHLKFELS
jgi:putative MATE family efflux protein